MIGRAEYSCGFSAVQEVYHYLFVLSLQQECNSIRPQVNYSSIYGIVSGKITTSRILLRATDMKFQSESQQ